MRVKLEKILCATDLSDLSNAAVPCGIAMAEAFGARLLVCHIIEMHTAGLYVEASLDPLELQKQYMDDIKDAFDRLIGSRAIGWEPLVDIGYPPDEIVRLADVHRADLVITATHGRSGLRRLILGSVAERLMRTLPCPSLVVNSRGQKPAVFSESVSGMKRVLVGCDFSSDSQLAFQHALSFAQEFQAELHLVHVVEPRMNYHSPPNAFHVETKMDGPGMDRLADRLARMVPDDARNWCVPVTTVVSGRPFEEIVSYARERDVDMIFLGIRGHGLIETYLVGSTTDRVIRQAPCPVFSARPVDPPVVKAGSDPQ